MEATAAVRLNDQRNQSMPKDVTDVEPTLIFMPSFDSEKAAHMTFMNDGQEHTSDDHHQHVSKP